MPALPPITTTVCPRSSVSRWTGAVIAAVLMIPPEPLTNGRRFVQSTLTSFLNLGANWRRRPIEQFAATIALEIRTVSGNLKRRLRADVEHNDLNASQVSVVLRLEKDGSATVSSLARAEGMRPQSMSAVITPLQNAGLVSGASDPNVGRQTLMCLTPKCLKLLKERRAAKQDWLTKRISEKLSVGEQEKLKAALGLLMRLVED
jgi:DNA-binding MarR family transcriptional regulator